MSSNIVISMEDHCNIIGTLLETLIRLPMLENGYIYQHWYIYEIPTLDYMFPTLVYLSTTNIGHMLPTLVYLSTTNIGPMLPTLIYLSTTNTDTFF